MKSIILFIQKKMVTSNTSVKYNKATGLVYLVIMVFDLLPYVLFRFIRILVYFIELISDLLLMVFGFPLHEQE